MVIPESHPIHHAVDPHFTHMLDVLESDTAKPFIIPILGLVAGIVLMNLPKCCEMRDGATVSTVGKLVLYFGAQSFMNIFMGWVFRTNVTVPKGYELPNGDILKEDLHGCPVGFALTAMQQFISFFCFIILYFTLYYTPYRIEPKKLIEDFSNITKAEWWSILSICIFGSVFALNIALNNFSLGYISIAVNLIIRSCLPLTTFLSQQGLAMFGLYPLKPWRFCEIFLMTLGVGCACAFTIAKIMGSEGSGKSGSNMILGAIICILSLLCGSLNLALAGVLGEMKLNVYDTVAYMSIPAFVFLIPFAAFLDKPVPGEWPQVFGVDHATDWQILRQVAVIAPKTFGLFALSGVFSFMYNIVQFSIVHTLSPSATAFGGNFNKAALVFLTLLLPFLQVHALPGPPYIEVIWAAVIGNVCAFSAYSYLQILEKEKAKSVQPKPEEKVGFTSDKEVEDWTSGSSDSEESGVC
mmetsp:Transcript_42322/g.94796  ORF Transcript_42322/g.94796 Transcript_42322/m.94796 type:complete len:467 (-) Transcript_42322:95-1495(-)